jgi:hypothetical protein
MPRLRNKIKMGEFLTVKKNRLQNLIKEINVGDKD